MAGNTTLGVTEGNPSIRNINALPSEKGGRRLTKLTDLPVDGTIDKTAFGERRETPFLEQRRSRKGLLKSSEIPRA